MRRSTSTGALQNAEVSILIREVAALERRLRGSHGGAGGCV
jgi:hypothetical protein